MNGFKYIRNQVINKTMEELALQLGVSKQAVYMWESRKKKIPEQRLVQLTELSGIPKKYFLIEELSDRDKLEIKRRYWLSKERYCAMATIRKTIPRTSSGRMEFKIEEMDAIAEETAKKLLKEFPTVDFFDLMYQFESSFRHKYSMAMLTEIVETTEED